ncbi:hypothetical protein QUA42_26040 [Microcoleus sp. Pol11C2]|uniref:hypothetical protein n=1 Tax=Microcoleus sp. Pol11C2 TaxID=3055389 RepID=UPI002FD2D1E6
MSRGPFFTIRAEEQAGQCGRVDKKLIKATILPSLLLGHYHGHKITDWEKFTKFVEVNGDKTQVEMAKLWTEEISNRTISRELKKMVYA